MIKKTAIIIVNWNGLKFLKDCLDSVYNQTYINFDIYFVDNGSKDESVVFVKNNFPRAKIIQLNCNTGFAKGTNIGLEEALKDIEIEYFVCLNNDTILYSNWLEELIMTAERNEKAGSVSSKAYFDDRKTIQNAGLAFNKSLQINRTGGISIGYGMTDEECPKLSQDIEIFAAGGVAPLFKRRVLELLIKRDGEIFDEDFFAYAEDYDLGFRIRSLGYKSFLSANAKLVHLHSMTGGYASLFKAFHIERNVILVAIKNLSIIDLILFPLRNLKIKFSYLLKKNDNISVVKIREKNSLLELFFVVVKGNFFALYLMPKIFSKRLRIKKYEKGSNYNSKLEWS